jgi:hypothetical protein
MFHHSDRNVCSFERRKVIAVLQQLFFAWQLENVLGVGTEDANLRTRAEKNQN